MRGANSEKNNRGDAHFVRVKSLGLTWHLDGAGLVCAIAYGVLAWFSLKPELLFLGLFYGLLSICLAATLVAFRGASEQPLTPLRLLLWAGCFHVIGVLGDPLWEDDFFRYLWDGYRFYETGSPYGIAPPHFLVMEQSQQFFKDCWLELTTQMCKLFMALPCNTLFC